MQPAHNRGDTGSRGYRWHRIRQYGRGAVLGPGQNNWDMALAKQFAIREGQSLMFRAEFFNTFNHAQFQIPNLSANQATFGQITALVVSPRVIQLALKYSF